MALMVVPHALVQWLHLILIAAILLLTTLGSTCARVFYRAAVVVRLERLLDLTYVRFREVRRLFAWKLGSERDGGSAKLSTFALSAPELIEAEGFRCEEHVVTTPDGYILTLHRIVRDAAAKGRPAMPRHHAHQEPTCRSEPTPFRARPTVGGCEGTCEGPPPVLFVHGLMQSSEVWLLGGRAASLPMRLASRSSAHGQAYDVWLVNIRGNFYSQKHLRLSPDQDEFWAFDLDSIARYDVPCTIKYVLAATGYNKLAVVGFSQGEGTGRWIAAARLVDPRPASCRTTSLLPPDGPHVLARRLRDGGGVAIALPTPERPGRCLRGALACHRRARARAVARDGAGGGGPRLHLPAVWSEAAGADCGGRDAGAQRVGVGEPSGR
jgi:pimeloyl-ACP methyl ester carboxylesterase